MVQRVSRRLVKGIVASLVGLSLLGGMTGTASADEVSTQDTTATEAQVRAEIAAVTNWQLKNSRPFKTSSTSPIYNSTPSGSYNYLGRNGSNANRNIFNGYNGLEWCGYFARWAWTKGGAYSVPQLPASYPSSQAWMTNAKADGNWFGYGSTLPKLGDVLVWTNNGDSGSGHVAVVTYVNTAERAITYIGGNEGTAGNKDSIVQHSQMWSNMDVAMSGKTFRGFASRF
jgi:hypothetical protein